MIKMNILSMICVFGLLSSKAEVKKPLTLKNLRNNTLNHVIEYGDSLHRKRGKNDVALGISLGTQGIGIETQVPLNYLRWQLRMGATILPFKLSNDVMAFPSRSVVANLNGGIIKFQVLTDWEPFPFSSAPILQKLVFSGGLSYFLSAKGTARMKLKDPYYYGDIELSQDQVGELKVVSNWKGLTPYLGAGLNRLRLTYRVSMDVSAGVFYLSSPSVQLTGTNMLSENSQNQAQLQSNLNKYRLLPSIQFCFNYHLR
jgi:hypothetical protein